MNSASTNPQNKRNATSQRRGQIKAQIFASFADTVSSVASKAGKAMSKLMGVGGTDVAGSPASATPAPSPIQTSSPDASPES